MEENNKNKSSKVIVGIISYKDKKYLEKGIPTLLVQDYKNFEIIVCDNSPELEMIDWIHSEFPEIVATEAGGNVGFGLGHNHMMSLAIERGADYYLCFNSDMFASKTYISELVKYFEKFKVENPNKKLGCVAPKLLEWKNFPESPWNIKENTYDTTGTIARIGNVFSDRGFGDPDKGQYKEKENVWGASGASPMFPVEVLLDIQHKEGEFFDANYFMYKEDIDLSYRLRWAGYEIRYTSNSVAWHDRTGSDPGGFWVQIKERRSRPAYIKNNSFVNHLQTVYKNWSPEFSWKMKLKNFWFIFKYFVYLILFDWSVLKQYKRFKKLKPELLEKRKSMPRRISAQEMEALFNLN